MSTIGCRFQMLLGHTFMFRDIGLCRKIFTKLKTSARIIGGWGIPPLRLSVPATVRVPGIPNVAVTESTELNSWSTSSGHCGLKKC